MEKMFTVKYILFLVPFAYCNPCSRLESLNITSGVEYSNGSIIYDGMEYTKGTWYVLEEDGIVTKFGCPCIGHVCLWKCCGKGQAYFNKTCLDTNISVVNPFSPPIHKGRDAVEVASHLHFFYMYTQLCDDKYMVDSLSSNEESYIQENGTLYEIASNSHQWHAPTTFCVDMMTTDMGIMDTRLVALVCYPDDVSSDDSSILYTAYAVGLMLSIPFLMATFFVYAWIPELRNLHGMCLMAYCMGLIVAYAFLAYLKLHTGKIGVAMTGCYFLAFIVYYAFQTSFFWLNVMCFDIWRTFRYNYLGICAFLMRSSGPRTGGLNSSQQSKCGYRGSSNKRRDKKRFAWYGLYAWGVPVILTGCTAAMQFADLPNNIITPGFANRRCWFEDWLNELVYFFTPVLVLVVCNVALFSITAHRIRSIRQETAILKGAESARSDKLKRDKQRYALYLKLFMVMGVNWTVEIISFAVGGSNWYWIVVDISNIALGVFIFLIFVWKNKVRNLISKKWRSLRGVRSTADTSHGQWVTRSSSAPTEDTRVSADESAIRLKDLH